MEQLFAMKASNSLSYLSSIQSGLQPSTSDPNSGSQFANFLKTFAQSDSATIEPIFYFPLKNESGNTPFNLFVPQNTLNKFQTVGLSKNANTSFEFLIGKVDEAGLFSNQMMRDLIPVETTDTKLPASLIQLAQKMMETMEDLSDPSTMPVRVQVDILRASPSGLPKNESSTYPGPSLVFTLQQNTPADGADENYPAVTSDQIFAFIQSQLFPTNSDDTSINLNGSSEIQHPSNFTSFPINRTQNINESGFSNHQNFAEEKVGLNKEFKTIINEHLPQKIQKKINGLFNELQTAYPQEKFQYAIRSDSKIDPVVQSGNSPTPLSGNGEIFQLFIRAEGNQVAPVVLHIPSDVMEAQSASVISGTIRDTFKDMQNVKTNQSNHPNLKLVLDAKGTVISQQVPDNDNFVNLNRDAHTGITWTSLPRDEKTSGQTQQISKNTSFNFISNHNRTEMQMEENSVLPPITDKEVVEFFNRYPKIHSYIQEIRSHFPAAEIEVVPFEDRLAVTNPIIGELNGASKSPKNNGQPFQFMKILSTNGEKLEIRVNARDIASLKGQTSFRGILNNENIASATANGTDHQLIFKIIMPEADMPPTVNGQSVKLNGDFFQQTELFSHSFSANRLDGEQISMRQSLQNVFMTSQKADGQSSSVSSDVLRVIQHISKDFPFSKIEWDFSNKTNSTAVKPNVHYFNLQTNPDKPLSLTIAPVGNQTHESAPTILSGSTSLMEQSTPEAFRSAVQQVFAGSEQTISSPNMPELKLVIHQINPYQSEEVVSTNSPLSNHKPIIKTPLALHRIQYSPGQSSVFGNLAEKIAHSQPHSSQFFREMSSLTANPFAVENSVIPNNAFQLGTGASASLPQLEFAQLTQKSGNSSKLTQPHAQSLQNQINTSAGNAITFHTSSSGLENHLSDDNHSNSHDNSSGKHHLTDGENTKQSEISTNDTFEGSVWGTRLNKQDFVAEKSSRLIPKTQLHEQARKMIEQITNQIKLKFGKQKADISIRLHPESMGKLQIKMEIVNNTIHLAMVAEKHESKELLGKHIDNLKENLTNQGYRIDRVTIITQDEKTSMQFQSDFSRNWGGHSRESGNNNQSPSFTGQKGLHEGFETESEEKPEKYRVRAKNSTIDLTV